MTVALSVALCWFAPQTCGLPVAGESTAVELSATPPPGPVERWRPLVRLHFPPGEVETALCLIRAESQGNPTADNPRSSAAGLWQFIRSTWNTVARNLDGPAYSTGAPYNPRLATRYAAWLWSQDGWGHWSPYQRGECR